MNQALTKHSQRIPIRESDGCSDTLLQVLKYLGKLSHEIPPTRSIPRCGTANPKTPVRTHPDATGSWVISINNNLEVQVSNSSSHSPGGKHVRSTLLIKHTNSVFLDRNVHSVHSALSLGLPLSSLPEVGRLSFFVKLWIQSCCCEVPGEKKSELQMRITEELLQLATIYQNLWIVSCGVMFSSLHRKPAGGVPFQTSGAAAEASSSSLWKPSTTQHHVWGVT